MDEPQWNAADERHRRDLAYQRVSWAVGLGFAACALVGNLGLSTAGAVYLPGGATTEAVFQVLRSTSISLALLGYVGGRALVERLLLAAHPHWVALRRPAFWGSLVGIALGMFVLDWVLPLLPSTGSFLSLPALLVVFLLWQGLVAARRVAGGADPAKVLEHAVIVPGCMVGMLGVMGLATTWSTMVGPQIAVGTALIGLVGLLGAMMTLPNLHRQVRIFSASMSGEHDAALRWVEAVGLAKTPLHKALLIDADRLEEAEKLGLDAFPGLDAHVALRRGDPAAAVPLFEQARLGSLPSFGPELRARLALGESEGPVVEELADAAMNRAMVSGVLRWLGYDERPAGFATVAWLRALQGRDTEASELLQRALDGRNGLHAMESALAWPLAEAGRLLDHPEWRTWARRGVELSGCRNCRRLLEVLEGAQP